MDRAIKRKDRFWVMRHGPYFEIHRFFLPSIYGGMLFEDEFTDLVIRLGAPLES